MNPTRMQTRAVQQFTCLAAQCPDTCCVGWGMQVTPETIAQYQEQAPELLDAVEPDGAAFVMKRDPATLACVKFDTGLCAIQKDYSEELLGDACYFFPRITRALGSSLLTTMTLACPEAARLMLYAPDAFALTQRTHVRTPYSLRNYLPKQLGEEEGLMLHALFMQLAAEEAVTPAHSLMRISAVARAFEMQPVTSWMEAMLFYTTIADSRIPKPEWVAVDLFNLCHALHGLVVASHSQAERLMDCVHAMAGLLGMRFDSHGGILLADNAAECAVRALAIMRRQAPVLHPVLRRYLAAQISESLFPFAGLGHTLSERITIIGVRYATMRLALATLGDTPTQDAIVRIIQTVSRFSDHLADATLSLQIYRETGWVHESRLHAIVAE